jgi:hypothetical protein
VTSFLQRALALAGAALLAGVFALALSDRGSGRPAASAPKPAVGPGAGWLTVAAGVKGGDGRRRSSCGWVLERGTLGIIHPVLPCGTKLFVAYGDRQAFTRVVDRGLVREGRAFDLTAVLAAKLGVRGVREVRWAFAGR